MNVIKVEITFVSGTKEILYIKSINLKDRYLVCYSINGDTKEIQFDKIANVEFVKVIM